MLVGSSKREKKDGNNIFQKDIVDWADEHDGDVDAAEQRLASINDFLNEAVTRDWQDNIAIKRESDFEKCSIEKSPSGGSEFIDYFLRIKRGRQTFALHERSKGFKWFFCFKILTDIRQHRNGENGILFLLDEPASNLHIYPQEKVLDSLEKLSNNKKNSVIYAAHMPFLINVKNKNNIIIVSNNRGKEFENPEILCTKLTEYKAKNDESLAALEPFLSKFALDGLKSTGKTWKERLTKTRGMIEGSYSATKAVGAGAEMIESILGLLP